MSRRPNILFLCSDDQGSWALGCHGNQEIRTPHLDGLAASGLDCTHFFCTSPVCSPARASLLTGAMPSQHGIHDWILGGNEDVPYLAGQTTWVELLAAAGHRCGLSGKWHLGASGSPAPGFAHWFACPVGGGTYRDAPMYRGKRKTGTHGYLTDLIADDAIGFIERCHAEQTPFAAVVAFTAPHNPWIDQHPPEIVASYDDCPFHSCPQEAQHPWVRGDDATIAFNALHCDPPHRAFTVHDMLSGYFAAVTAMDASIGRILARLDALGLREDTLVVFTSDNGFNCGHHGIWGKGNATHPQNLYDTSVRVPFLVSQPGRIPAGGRSSALLSAYDLFPTLLGWCDVQAPAHGRPLPGSDIAGVWTGAADAPARPVVVYDEYGPARMIRTADFKYIHRTPHGPHELYDLVHDPDERVDLLADHRRWRAEEDVHARADDLRQQLEAWFATWSDPLRDGRLQAVDGRGQWRPIGDPAAAGPAYRPHTGATGYARARAP